jgi:4-methyl-5(b-hydroxyethyl)-thiazole monophosphate biosynthesis
MLEQKKICIHLADGFEEVEAITPIDVLRRAGHEVTIVSVDEKVEVRGGQDIIVNANLKIDEINYDEYDMLILPGGNVGTNNLEEHQKLKEVIQQFDQQKKWIAAICAAPRVLGKLGILDGRKATCYPGNEEYLAGAEVTGNETEVDGHIITGRGVGVAMNFALKIVEVIDGKDKAKELAAKMVFPINT